MVSDIHRRLDALDVRLSWFYVRLLLLTGVTWAVHAAELVLFVFTRRLVAKSVGMGTYALEALGTAIFVGAAMGGPLFGHLADVRGRQSALLLAMGLSLVGLALSAMATKHYQVIAARVVAGVGLGGELPAATVLVQEMAPRPMRGRIVALLEAFKGVGGVVGVALAFGVAPQLGWRATYLVICGLVVYVGVLRLSIPESPRWLASVGRVDEALKVVKELEHEHGKRCQQNSNVHGSELVTARTNARTKPSIFETPVHTLMLWALWTVMEVSSYALGVYVPTLISLWGFNVFEHWSTMTLLALAQVFGCVVASLVLDEYGRRLPLALFSTSAAVVAMITSLAPWYGPFVLLGSCTVSVFLAASWSCVLVYAPDNFATEVRGRGVGYAFGFSRFGAIGGSLLYPHMFNVWKMSIPAIASVFAGLLVVVVLGLVLPYGLNISKREDVDDIETQKAYRLLGVETSEEGTPLVINAASPRKTGIYYS